MAVSTRHEPNDHEVTEGCTAGEIPKLLTRRDVFQCTDSMLYRAFQLKTKMF